MMTERARSQIFYALMVVHTLLLAYGAWLHGPGWDEIGHLPAGISHWQTGTTDLYRVNPPLVRIMATAVLAPFDFDLQWAWHSGTRERPEFELGDELWRKHGWAAFRYLTYARWSVIPLSLLGAVVIRRWANRLYGPEAALFSVAMWCFSPMVLTNAQMITPDIGSATLGLLSWYATWRWWETRAWDLAVIAGIFLGIAELTKFTWIVLFPMVGAIALWGICVQAVRGSPQVAKTLTWQFGVLIVLALVVINAGYAFEGTFQTLGSYRFISRDLQPDSDDIVIGEDAKDRENRFRGHWVGGIPVPLPANYVLGMDRQKYDFESRFESYLRGEWRDRGWWYYYLYGIAVKEPIGYLALSLLGIFHVGLVRRISKEEVWLMAPAVVVFVFVSSQTGFNHHLRYVLPSYPFVFVWLGRLWERPLQRSRWTIMASAGLAFGIGGSLWVYPHSHAFFNSLAGGPMHGHKHLLDSNIDWGQDLLELARWQQRHPEVPLDGVAFSPGHLIDRAVIGLPTMAPPRGAPPSDSSEQRPANRSDQYGPQLGNWAVFVRPLRERNAGVEYFRFFQPDFVVGYTVYIYRLDADDVDRYWQSNGRLTQ